MADVVRQEVIAGAHTVVVKVGTNVLARPDGTLDQARFAALADQIRARPCVGAKPEGHRNVPSIRDR